MSRALTKALEDLMGTITKSKSRMEAIVAGAGAPGARVAPKRAGNNDAKIGVRIDRGETFKVGDKEYVRYKLQVNKNADNPTLKAMAARDSHADVSYADVEVNPEADLEDAMDSFSSDMKKNMKNVE